MAKSNYIDNMIRQYGENWIVALRPEDIQRSSKRLIKDMVRGNIDYEKYGQYFLDAKFLENLLIAVTNDYEVNSLHYNAMYMYQQMYPSTPSAYINHDYALYVIYGTIMTKLNQVKSTQNVGWLADISAVLYHYRNHLV
jgi:hypothetical protein